MAAWVRSLHFLQYPWFIRSNCITPGRYPCAARCSILALERLLRTPSAGRCLLPVDGYWHYPHCWWCSPHRYLRHRTGANTLVGRLTRTLQTAYIHCVFLDSRICSDYLSCDSEPLLRLKLHLSHISADPCARILFSSQNFQYLSL